MGNKKKLLSTRILLAVVLSVILLISLVIMAAACNQQEQDTDKIGVVVTILPQAEFVGSIGGDRVEITVMVPPGASPNTRGPARTSESSPTSFATWLSAWVTTLRPRCSHRSRMANC